MTVFSALDQITAQEPVALTLGTFDGVHLGHQAILNRLHQVSTHTACITFNNHPSETLRPDSPTPLLSTVDQKTALLEQYGIDVVLLLHFTTAFANCEAADFLRSIQRHLPFSHLILGHDARIGKDRSGTPKQLHKLAEQLGFILEYIPAIELGGEPISSTRIRHELTAGNLELVEQMLGRKISFQSVVHRGAGKGRLIGFPTANLDISPACTPPRGVYAVSLTHHGKIYPGIANLGVAPTLMHDRPQLLEVHLFEFSKELYEQQVEVTLHAFIRPEQKFASVDALRTQIAADVQQAKSQLTS